METKVTRFRSGGSATMSYKGQGKKVIL